MCNLYNVTTTREAVMQFTKAFSDKAGWNEPSLDVYPGYQAPIVRLSEDGQREIAHLGHAVAASLCEELRSGRHQYPQRRRAALAALAWADKPLRRAVYLLRGAGSCQQSRRRQDPERLVCR